MSLHLVRDRETYLGSVRADGAGESVTDDELVLEGEKAQASVLKPAVNEVPEGSDASEEAEIARLERERLVEVDQRVAVGRAGTAKVNGRTVAENGV